MKKLLILFVTAVTIASCSSPSNKVTTTDTVVAGDTLAKGTGTKTTNHTSTVSSLCFLNTKNRDSTSIELVIRGSKGTGQMNWLPYQKDSRKGKLEGTVKDSIVNATWTFMQEGMTDTLNLNFKLTNNTLLQKPLKLNTKTGRDQTDGAAAYSLIYGSSERLHK